MLVMAAMLILSAIGPPAYPVTPELPMTTMIHWSNRLELSMAEMMPAGSERDRVPTYRRGQLKAYGIFFDESKSCES